MCCNLQCVMDREPDESISRSPPTSLGHKNSSSIMMYKLWPDQIFLNQVRGKYFFQDMEYYPTKQFEMVPREQLIRTAVKMSNLLFSEPNSSSILAWIFDTGKSNISTARMEDRASSRVHDIRPGKQQAKLAQCGLGVLYGILINIGSAHHLSHVRCRAVT